MLPLCSLKALLPSLKVPCQQKKLDITVLGGTYSETPYYEATTRLLSGSEEPTVYLTPNGMRFIIRENEDIYEFQYPFAFQYIHRGNAGDDYSNIVDKANLSRLPKVNFIRSAVLTHAMKEFLQAGGLLNGSDISSELRIRIEPSDFYYDEDNRIYITEISQYAGSEPIIGCVAKVALNDDNKVVYVSGNLILCNLSESFNTELLDQINLILKENRELSQTDESEPEISAPNNGIGAGDILNGSNSYGDSPSSSLFEKNQTYTLTSAQGCYSINWNNDRSKFYLLPAWEFVYNSSIVRIRNAIDGSVYSK